MGPQSRCEIAALLVCNVIFCLLECRLFNKMNTVWLESMTAAAAMAKEEVQIQRGVLEGKHVQVNQSSLQLKN